MLPYTLLADVALYAILAKHSDRIHSAIAAALLVGGSLTLRIIEYTIIYGTDNAYTNFTQTSQIVTIVLQYTLSIVIFHKIRTNGEEDLPAYLGWVAVGWFIIFMAIPFVIGKVL